MVSPAQWHGEFIADLTAERLTLRKAHVVGIRWLSTANEARLLGNEPDVIPVTNPARLRQSEHALIDAL